MEDVMYHVQLRDVSGIEIFYKIVIFGYLTLS